MPWGARWFHGDSIVGCKLVILSGDFQRRVVKWGFLWSPNVLSHDLIHTWLEHVKAFIVQLWQTTHTALSDKSKNQNIFHKVIRVRSWHALRLQDSFFSETIFIPYNARRFCKLHNATERCQKSIFYDLVWEQRLCACRPLWPIAEPTNVRFLSVMWGQNPKSWPVRLRQQLLFVDIFQVPDPSQFELEGELIGRRGVATEHGRWDGQADVDEKPSQIWFPSRLMQPLNSRYAVVSIKKLFDVKLGTFHVHGPATVKLNAFFWFKADDCEDEADEKCKKRTCRQWLYSTIYITKASR